MSEEIREKLNAIYGQIYELSIMIGQLIDRKQIGSIDNFLEIKQGLYFDLEPLLKELGKDADLSEFIDICQKIREQETMNINLLTTLGQEIKQELDKINKKTKVINAYSQIETKQGNLLDFRE